MLLARELVQPALFWIFWIGVVASGLGMLYFCYGMYRATKSSGWLHMLFASMAAVLTLIFSMVVSDRIPASDKQTFMVLIGMAALFESILLPKGLNRLCKEQEIACPATKKVILFQISFFMLFIGVNASLLQPLSPLKIAVIGLSTVAVARLFALGFISRIRSQKKEIYWALLYIFMLTTSLSLIGLLYTGGCCGDSGQLSGYATCKWVYGHIGAIGPQFCPTSIPQLYLTFIWIFFVGMWVGTIALYNAWTNIGDDLL